MRGSPDGTGRFGHDTQVSSNLERIKELMPMGQGATPWGGGCGLPSDGSAFVYPARVSLCSELAERARRNGVLNPRKAAHRPPRRHQAAWLASLGRPGSANPLGRPAEPAGLDSERPGPKQ
eukprot:gene12484-biopygen2736